jgi:RNA polymerase sigma-70 factor, ECF subfamily
VHQAESRDSGEFSVTEEQLVQKCRNGDREAQREIYAQTSDRIYRLLLRMTGRPEDAFDLTQDTYLKVFGAIDRFQGSSELTTWIYQIAVNEARQFLRRRRLHQTKLKLLTGLSEASATQCPDVDAAADVQDALTRLPESERALIVLRHFDHLSYEQMAQVLDKPPGTVASALNRARRMLRELLEEDSTAAVKNPLPESI